jgi:hypothetical protein
MPVLRLTVLALLLLGTGCQSPSSPSSTPADASSPPADDYTAVRLAPSLSDLSDAQMEATTSLIEAAQAMDAVFWEQTYGNRDSLRQTLADSLQRRAVQLNYGPWNRLRADAPILNKIGPRPPGANFYPTGLSADAGSLADTLRTPHTMVRRLPDGSLTALPYHLFFAETLTSAAFQLRDAAEQMSGDALESYLERRADALLNGDYAPSETAWHDLDTPTIDLLIGPMDTGEDRLLGVKESAAGIVLRRNAPRSQQLSDLLSPLSARLSTLALDTLVQTRSVPTQNWGAYDALYVTGGLNTGPKATVLPLSPTGPRRLLLANVLRARAANLLRPTAEEVLVEPRRSAVTPEALFAHTALRTWSRAWLPAPPPGDRPAAVRTAAAATALALALAPSDTTNADAHYATAVADLLHTVRVDSTSRDGRAARLLLGALQTTGALTTTESSRYRVVRDMMAQVLPTLIRDLHVGRVAAPSEKNQQDLTRILVRLDDARVPRGLAFKQGAAVLSPLQAATRSSKQSSAALMPHAPRPTGR